MEDELDMNEEELQEFANFLRNMSESDFDKTTKEVEQEIFSKDFCKELNSKEG